MIVRVLVSVIVIPMLGIGVRVTTAATLSPTSLTISGTVLSGATGIGGICVEAQPTVSGPAVSVLSAANGTYTLSGLTAEGYVVEFNSATCTGTTNSAYAANDYYPDSSQNWLDASAVTAPASSINLGLSGAVRLFGFLYGGTYGVSLTDPLGAICVSVYAPDAAHVAESALIGAPGSESNEFVLSQLSYSPGDYLVMNTIQCTGSSNPNYTIDQYFKFDQNRIGLIQYPTDFSAVVIDVSTLLSGNGLRYGGCGINSGCNTYLSNVVGPAPSALSGGGSPDEHATTCSCGQPVNTDTGEFWHTFSDLSVPGRGKTLHLTRTYSSLTAATLGPLGYGWTDSYNMWLSFDGAGDAIVHEENGSAITAYVAGSVYQFPTSVSATLVENGDGTFTFTRHDQSRYTFSADGLLENEIDRNGYVTTLGYNVSGQLTGVTDPAGRHLLMTYGSNGLVSSVSDPSGRKVTFGYDGSKNLLSATNVGGRAWTFTYDANHLLLTMTDPRRGVTTNTFDGSGRVVSQSDPLGRATTYAYSGGAGSGTGTTTLTDPRHVVTDYQYTSNELTSVISAVGTAQQATWRYAYDPNVLGETSVTDPDGHTTTATYDAAGNVLTRRDPLGLTTTYTYNAFNEPLSATDPLGTTTTNTYDARGNLLTTSTPLGGTSMSRTTTYSYGNAAHPGDVTATVDPDIQTTHYAYDKYGNQVSLTDPDGHTTTTKYNVIGEKTSSTTPAGHVTKYAYDPFGDLHTTTDPLGNGTTNSYDADQNLASSTDPSGHTTTYAYNADNELTKTTAANGSSIRNVYNADGKVISTTDADGRVTADTYDPLNRLASTKNPLGQISKRTYDGVGNLLTTTDASRRVTTNAYDADNELTMVGYSDGTTAGTSFTYDADGRRTSMADGTGTTTYSYDTLGRVTSSTNGAGQTVGYVYDLKNQLTSLTYPNAKTVTNTFDPVGNLTAVTDWHTHTSRFTYDADANLTSSVAGSATPVTDSSTYNADDTLTSITDIAGSTTLQAFAYSRNADQLVASATPSGKPTQNYAYDAVNQLTQDNQGAYGYSPAGDITTMLATTPMTFNAGHELSTAGTGAAATSFAYNPEGERTAQTTTSGPATVYAYDQAGRLTGFSNGTTTAAYTYDGDGLRATKTVGATTTNYTWKALGLPLLLDDGTTSYIYGPGGQPLEQINNASGATAFYHHDQLGSTTMLTNVAGSNVATMTYNSYGKLISRTGTVTTPLLYAGQYRDVESGLYYLRARYYDPATGQFVSADPALSLTSRPYGYASDNPTNFTDPLGLLTTKERWEAAGALALLGSGLVLGCVLTACAAPLALVVAGLAADGVGVAATIATGDLLGLVVGMAAEAAPEVGGLAISVAYQLASFADAATHQTDEMSYTRITLPQPDVCGSPASPAFYPSPDGTEMHAARDY